MKSKITGANLILYIAIAISLLLSCSGQPPTYQEVDAHEVYASAIQDAEIAEPDEISRNLVAIVYYNERLIWDGDPGDSRVLVVTWTSWDGYNDEVGKSTVTTRDIWVTVAPDIRDFCSDNKFSHDELTLRLEQLMGLPPNSGKEWFVEIWVHPDNLFRPSPDPEITDYESELDFHNYVPEKHIKWFNDLKAKSYGENGYPWTRLGYTYDWGNPESEIGLSEFVIKAGATIVINSVSITRDYCN